MPYAVGPSIQTSAVYPGYAPTPVAPGGASTYQAQLLALDTFVRQAPNQATAASYSVPSPVVRASGQGNAIAPAMSYIEGFIASLLNRFRHPPAPAQPQPAPATPANPYAGVPLPDRTQQSDEAFVTSLYAGILGRQPDPQGFQAHVAELRNGMDRHDLYRIFMESDEYRARLQAPAQPPQAAPAPAPAPTPAAATAPLPPVTPDAVKQLAKEYVAQHPEIANAPSYDDLAAVGQLRDGVIAMLNAKGYRAGRILGPDGNPYPQMIAFGNASDPTAMTYRVTAGGAAIREAITVGYTNDNIPWSDVH